MKCQEFQKELFSGNLNLQSKDILKHLDKCEGCRILYELEKENYSDKLIFNAKTDEFFFTRVYSRLKANKVQRTFLNQWLVAASIAVILSLAGMMGYLIGNHNSLIYAKKSSVELNVIENEYFNLISQNEITENYLNLISNE